MLETENRFKKMYKLFSQIVSLKGKWRLRMKVDKQQHLAFLNKDEYQPKCDLPNLNNIEIRTIKKYGHWLQALEDGTLQPITELQEAFLKVMKREQKPVSVEEQAWFKYKGRLKYVEKYGDHPPTYAPEDDTFYSREQYRQQRSTMYKVINETHRQ